MVYIKKKNPYEVNFDQFYKDIQTFKNMYNRTPILNTSKATIMAMIYESDCPYTMAGTRCMTYNGYTIAENNNMKFGDIVFI